MKAVGIPEHFLFPSTLFVEKEPYNIVTILGSCISVCLFDTALKYGGMNHFMMPWWDGKGMPSPKFGDVATEQLIEKMISMGSRREHLQAKIFGGAHQHSIGRKGFTIGDQNIATAENVLAEYRIKIVARHTGGDQGCRIVFHSHTHRIFMSLLEKHQLKKVV
jgi:chemotaxis protein CheD